MIICAIDIGAGGGTRIVFFNAGDNSFLAPNGAVTPNGWGEHNSSVEPNGSVAQNRHTIASVESGHDSVVGSSVIIPRKDYGTSYEKYRDNLIHKIEEKSPSTTLFTDEPIAIGISTPGILKNDGAFQRVHNLEHFEGNNLKIDLEKHFGIPVGIENDANAGGLAEWSVLRTDLLYWVFGGGWGGAWISGDGGVQFPVRDWDGRDDTMHPTNEPGFAVPLEKRYVRERLQNIDGAYVRLEELLCAVFKPEGGVLTGPGGNKETLRAEIILSGPGRARLFQAITGKGGTEEKRPNGQYQSSECTGIGNGTEPNAQPIAGEEISALSQKGVEAAVMTDRIFGEVLGKTAQYIVDIAEKQGLPRGAPICIGGKPARALPYFGPTAQTVLAQAGFTNYLRPSIIDERRSENANLIGAAVVGEKAYFVSKGSI